MLAYIFGTCGEHSNISYSGYHYYSQHVKSLRGFLYVDLSFLHEVERRCCIILNLCLLFTVRLQSLKVGPVCFHLYVTSRVPGTQQSIAVCTRIR